MEPRFLRVLPFFLEYLTHDRECEQLLPVALWKSSENLCALRGDHRCDDSEGLFYTVAGDEATWLCPRHWYAQCLPLSAPYRLREMTSEQYREECRRQQERLLADWRTASERVASAASLLASAGLQDEAGKLYEARGFIDASIRGRL